MRYYDRASNRLKVLLFFFILQWLLFSSAYGIEDKTSYATLFKNPSTLTWDGNYLWLADSGESKIFKINPNGGIYIDEISTPNNPIGIAWDGTKLLVICSWNNDKIYSINISNKSDIKEIKTLVKNPERIVWDGNNFWITDNSLKQIYKISGNNPANLDVRIFNYPDFSDSMWSDRNDITDLSWDGNYLLATVRFAYETGKIVKINPEDGNIIGILKTNSTYPMGITWDGNNIWYIDYIEHRIVKDKEELITPLQTPDLITSIQKPTSTITPLPISQTPDSKIISPSKKIINYSINITKTSETSPESNDKIIKDIQTNEMNLIGTAFSEYGIKSININNKYIYTNNNFVEKQNYNVNITDTQNSVVVVEDNDGNKTTKIFNYNNSINSTTDSTNLTEWINILLVIITIAVGTGIFRKKIIRLFNKEK